MADTPAVVTNPASILPKQPVNKELLNKLGTFAINWVLPITAAILGFFMGDWLGVQPFISDQLSKRTENVPADRQDDAAMVFTMVIYLIIGIMLWNKFGFVGKGLSMFHLGISFKFLTMLFNA